MVLGEFKINNKGIDKKNSQNKDCLIAPLYVIVGSHHNFNDVQSSIHEQGIASKEIIMDNNVWLGAQVTVLNQVEIEDNTIMGSGSNVAKNIPENSVAVGNSCKVIKVRLE